MHRKDNTEELQNKRQQSSIVARDKNTESHRDTNGGKIVCRRFQENSTRSRVLYNTVLRVGTTISLVSDNKELVGTCTRPPTNGTEHTAQTQPSTALYIHLTILHANRITVQVVLVGHLDSLVLSMSVLQLQVDVKLAFIGVFLRTVRTSVRFRHAVFRGHVTLETDDIGNALSADPASVRVLLPVDLSNVTLQSRRLRKRLSTF